MPEAPPVKLSLMKNVYTSASVTVKVIRSYGCANWLPVDPKTSRKQE